MFFAALDYTAINLALNKLAVQTSTWTTAVASQAVDGNQGTVSCTNPHINPWLSVDLGAPFDIGHVTVTNDGYAPLGNYRRTSCITNVL